MVVQEQQTQREEQHQEARDTHKQSEGGMAGANTQGEAHQAAGTACQWHHLPRR